MKKIVISLLLIAGMAQVSRADAPFCVVASWGTQCFYWTADACYEAARSINGMCIVNPNR